MPAWRWAAVVAHRCGGRLAPENSIEGLCAAAAAGIQAVEFDAMLAACGTPVVIHDETLERTTSGAGRVASTVWNSLAHLRLRDDQGRLTDASLPRLADVLATCAELGLSANVEIKPSRGAAAATGSAVARLTADLVGTSGLPVLLTSFEHQALEAAMQAAPELTYGHLFDQPVDVALASGQLSGCAHLVFSDAMVSQSGVQRAMTDGYGVAVYTVNDPARARQLWSWGVEAVITDEPLRLQGGGP